MKTRVKQAEVGNTLDFLKDSGYNEDYKYVDKFIAVSQFIENQLKRNDFKQKEVAEKLGMAESQLSKWLSGFHNLTLKSILKLESVCPIEILNPIIWENTPLVNSVVASASTNIESTSELLNSPSPFATTLSGFSESALAELLAKSSITATQKTSNKVYAMAA